MICQHCNQKFPEQIVIDGKLRSLYKRKFCLQCSPFNQHKTRSPAFVSSFKLGHKICPKCQTEKDASQFYLRRNNTSLSPYCRECSSIEAVNRQRELKKQCVEYKGGKCKNCGYNKCLRSLNFHHIDPTQKDFSICHVRKTLFNDKIKSELDKCQLLCSNCHGEVHEKLDDIS